MKASPQDQRGGIKDLNQGEAQLDDNDERPRAPTPVKLEPAMPTLRGTSCAHVHFTGEVVRPDPVVVRTQTLPVCPPVSEAQFILLN